MKKLLMASTSNVYGKPYLSYLYPVLKKFFKDFEEIIFIPFARPKGISHDVYTRVAQKGFSPLGIKIKGIHRFDNPREALLKAKGIFTGGGNTFVLVNTLHKLGLFDVLKEIVNNGVPYFGTSAGSNICCKTINNTNDMPIVYTPSFKAMQWVNFNINAHYFNHQDSRHMGETRDIRIKEFHTYSDIPVLGLREEDWLEVKGQRVTLRGVHGSRLFRKGELEQEIPVNTDISYLNV